MAYGALDTQDPRKLAFALDEFTFERLIAYCNESHVSRSKIVRHCLACMPYDEPGILPVILKIPMGIARNPALLAEWLKEAALELQSAVQTLPRLTDDPPEKRENAY